jgi:hypothetical protein
MRKPNYRRIKDCVGLSHLKVLLTIREVMTIDLTLPVTVFWYTFCGKKKWCHP